MAHNLGKAAKTKVLVYSNIFGEFRPEHSTYKPTNIGEPLEARSSVKVGFCWWVFPGDEIVAAVLGSFGSRSGPLQKPLEPSGTPWEAFGAPLDAK